MLKGVFPSFQREVFAFHSCVKSFQITLEAALLVRCGQRATSKSVNSRTGSFRFHQGLLAVSQHTSDDEWMHWRLDDLFEVDGDCATS